jgi:hypothetical protein
MMEAASCRLLTVNVPPALEDTFVDWLLSQGLEQGFTSYRADGHGSAHEHLTIGEQVRGRQRRAEFRLVLDEESARRIVDSLESDFAGADIFYFVLPVLRFGHLKQAAGASSAGP